MHEKRALRREVEVLRTRTASECGELVTEYAPLRAVLALVDRAAPSAAPVLIDGEPGTGKGLLAARIHARSGRPAPAYVAVDCRSLAALPDAADALFGRGAEPGRPGGLLAAAERGTVYLEHVDALPEAAQRRLLEHLVRPVAEGAAAPRVIASTTTDPERPGARLDPRLRDALSQVRATLPPLAERRTDVRPLVEHLVRQASAGASVVVDASALATLEGRPWPGNVDELRAVLEGAVVRARGGVIDLDALGLAATGAAPHDEVAREGASARGADASRTLAAAERDQIAGALAAARWHQGRAAEALGISARTLYRKIRAYGLSRPRSGAVREGSAASDAPAE
jgi:two-component system NtrC family response regulator